MAVKQFRRPYDYTPGQTKEVIEGEQHTIPVSPPYDIYLIHIPRKETPSTVRIPGFTEVDGPPGPGQYRVHYEEPGSDPLGRVEFHASDAGKLVAVDYHACGTAIWGEDRGDGRPNIAELQETLEGVQGGVIVEMGSNSNGGYVRWENGLQVCWRRNSDNDATTPTQYGSIYKGEGRTWTYPAMFVEVPTVLGAFLRSNDDRAGFIGWHSIDVDSAVFYVATTTGWANMSMTAHLVAVGRWK